MIDPLVAVVATAIGLAVLWIVLASALGGHPIRAALYWLCPQPGQADVARALRTVGPANNALEPPGGR